MSASAVLAIAPRLQALMDRLGELSRWRFMQRAVFAARGLSPNQERCALREFDGLLRGIAQLGLAGELDAFEARLDVLDRYAAIIVEATGQDALGDL